jgi:nucleotide-binding universal stress UspA family protein
MLDLALETAFPREGPGVPVMRSVVRGQAGPALCAAARDASLLVVGTAAEAHPGRRMVLGSVSEYYIRHSPVPVVIVRFDIVAGPRRLGPSAGVPTRCNSYDSHQPAQR